MGLLVGNRCSGNGCTIRRRVQLVSNSDPRVAPDPGYRRFRLDTTGRVRWDEGVTTDTATDVFEEHRPVLLGVAYRMLGRLADAEDVVQEAGLRWSGADRSGVREPRGYLVRVTTRLAIDRLRQVQVARRDVRRPVAARALRHRLRGRRAGHRGAGRPRRLRVPRGPRLSSGSLSVLAGAGGVRPEGGDAARRSPRPPRRRPRCSRPPISAPAPGLRPASTNTMSSHSVAVPFQCSATAAAFASFSTSTGHLEGPAQPLTL
ncbi:hypothetical protein SVIOM342S_08880 [Streptomyces violaceorubidus]